MKNMKLREKIGQMIVTGYPSADLTPDIIRLIEEYKVANVILFSYNIISEEQIRKNCRDLHQRIEQSTGQPAFIAIDQEGGVVTRLPKEANNVPGAMLIGATGNKEYAYQSGKITGTELIALGINIDLAPVLDVNSNPNNPVIGVRSYSSNPHTVKEFGVSMMKGLISSGVMATVKHFPGHGDTEVDSHLGLPVIEKEEQELMQCELIPFLHAIREGAPCVMSSHILFPKLEAERKPATMSKSILTGLLREKLGFEGLIITDCLEMSAIQTFYGTAQGSVEAVKAGAQLLCISHTPALVIEAIEKIEAAVATGEIALELIDKAVENILKFKAIYRIDSNQLEAVGISNTKNKRLMQEIIYSGITQVSKEELPNITEDTVFVGSYASRSTLVSNSDVSELHFAKYMAERFHCRYIDVAVNPRLEDRSRVLSEINKASNVIYGLYNGHLNLEQIDLANEISRKGYELVAVALRNPYDLALLDHNIYKIAAYEYNHSVFDALFHILKKEVPAGGILPVALTI